MVEIVCDSKSFTITVIPDVVIFEWNIVNPVIEIGEGEKAEVLIDYRNLNTYEHEVCFMLMDGTTVLDASPEACRAGVLLGHDIKAGVTERHKLYGKGLDTGVHNLSVKVCARKSLI